jgi:hypothetical protein
LGALSGTHIFGISRAGGGAVSGSDGQFRSVFLMERLLKRSRLCEDVNGLAASIAEEEFNGTGADVSYLFDLERHNYTQDRL